MELFTDLLHWETPEWVWQRWPRKVLQSLPLIDSQRVREVTFAFRQRTSCAEDHMVIEGHLGNSGEVPPVQTAAPLDTGYGHDVVKAERHAGVKKNGLLTMRGFIPHFWRVGTRQIRS